VDNGVNIADMANIEYWRPTLITSILKIIGQYWYRYWDIKKHRSEAPLKFTGGGKANEGQDELLSSLSNFWDWT